uniref:Cornifelin n=1 Tax=Naja naja TaxID=35670 RepID=A0A8C6XXE8_NAJNA
LSCFSTSAASCSIADCRTSAVLHTGLAGELQMLPACICGSLAPCILACQVSANLGEFCCLPCLPGAMVAARTALREQLRIEGNVCNDWVAACCCCPCAMCQMAREMKSPC